MRLWSIHPRYLDRAGLAALWRESLLAQKVLQGKTVGYRNHPQLIRFKNHPAPQLAISTYLWGVWEEAAQRGYCFDREKIQAGLTIIRIPVTRGQIKYEFSWLRHKLQERDQERCQRLESVTDIECHPLFTITPGGIEYWEKIK
ncbi:MAG: pyrimidine dimer DNA glycosylase/endonuclease V [Syntrophomonadaceae bacterium]